MLSRGSWATNRRCSSCRPGAESRSPTRFLPWPRAELRWSFTSPEKAESDGYLEHLLRGHKSRVTLVAVDEAHCISQWGHDFRPPYKSLPGFLDRTFGRSLWPPVLCLTATLDAYSQGEVLHDFRMREADAVRSVQMLGDNLNLSFQSFANTDEKLGVLEDVLERYRGQKIIVYAHLKQNKTAGTRTLTKAFKELGHRRLILGTESRLPRVVAIGRRADQGGRLLIIDCRLRGGRESAKSRGFGELFHVCCLHFRLQNCRQYAVLRA
jgi:hypothetical protein